MTTSDAARNACALRALERSTIRVEGPDAAAWLNGVITQDVPAPGRAGYALSLTRPGKITADLFCLATASAVFVAPPKGVHSELLDGWQRMLVMEDAELYDDTGAFEWLLAVGPERSRLTLPAGALAAELDHLGLGGALLALPSGSDLGSLGAPLLDDREWRRLRLERLVPEFGVDFGSKDRPHEAALDQRAVSWTKGCYLGQEVVCMQQMRGKVRRRLEVLAASGHFDGVPEAGTVLTDAAGARVGQVTSAADDPASGRGLLMAELEVAARDGVVLLPGSTEPLERLDTPL